MLRHLSATGHSAGLTAEPKQPGRRRIHRGSSLWQFIDQLSTRYRADRRSSVLSVQVAPMCRQC